MEQRRRNRRRTAKRNRRLVVAFVLLLVLLLAAVLAANFAGVFDRSVQRLYGSELPGWVDAQIIEIDGASRRGEKLDSVKNVVIHYIGNPGTSAQQNHDYFTNPDSEVSAHFVIGLGGEVIQCIPLDEKSSASNWRNNDTISIEVCHPDATGAFTQQSYDTLIELSAWVCSSAGLSAEDLIRHYDITGKQCPLYYVEHEDAWNALIADVGQRMKQS